MWHTIKVKVLLMKDKYKETKLKIKKNDEHREKMFREHGHKSLKKYEHESAMEHKAEHDSKKISPKKGKGKVAKVMAEMHEHKLHAGSKKGPLVTNPKQGIAIALSEARKAGEHIPKKHKK